MNVTLTLDVAGTNLVGTTFNVYEDVDLYTTATATNVLSSSLASGYPMTLNDNTTTVRIQSNGACGNYKDISVDAGDTTPSFVGQSIDTTTTIYKRIVGNGKSELYYSTNYNVRLSTDNGSTFSSPTAIPANITGSVNYGLALVHDGTDLYYISNKDNNLNIYKVTNYSSGFDVATYTSVLIQPIGESISIHGAYYINNAYYISTYRGIYRTKDFASLVLVFQPPYATVEIKGMDNYGNHIYCAASGPAPTGGIYKSIDNGLNWTQTLSMANIDRIDVESYTKHVATKIAGTYDGIYYYSTDGGSNYTEVDTNTLVFAGGELIQKYNSVYIVVARNGFYYTTNVYTPTPTFTNFGSMPAYTTAIDWGNTSLIQRDRLFFGTSNNFFRYVIASTI